MEVPQFTTEELKVIGCICLLCMGAVGLFLAYLNREEIKAKREEMRQKRAEMITRGIMTFGILRASIQKCTTRLQLDHLCDKSINDFKYEFQDDYFKTNRDILDEMVSDKKRQLRKLQYN